MVDFWGLWASALTVAVGIVGVGIMVWYELRKQNSKFKDAKDELNNMNGLLRNIIMGQIHEKIAILNNTVTEIPSWKPEDVEYKKNKMASDVRVISEVSSFLTSQQREQLRTVRQRLTQTLNQGQYDTVDVDAVFAELLSN
jgi:cell division protein ZapA (FtsZ GTPase activity inhibitor)